VRQNADLNLEPIWICFLSLDFEKGGLIFILWTYAESGDPKVSRNATYATVYDHSNYEAGQLSAVSCSDWLVAKDKHWLVNTTSQTLENGLLQIPQCEWSVSCTCDCTYCETTPLNLLLKSARTAYLVLNACSAVFILTNPVIFIDSSTWWQGGWWMMCATLGDTVSQKGQRYDK